MKYIEEMKILENVILGNFVLLKKKIWRNNQYIIDFKPIPTFCIKTDIIFFIYDTRKQCSELEKNIKINDILWPYYQYKCKIMQTNLEENQRSDERFPEKMYQLCIQFHKYVVLKSKVSNNFLRKLVVELFYTSSKFYSLLAD